MQRVDIGDIRLTVGKRRMILEALPALPLVACDCKVSLVKSNEVLKNVLVRHGQADCGSKPTALKSTEYSTVTSRDPSCTSTITRALLCVAKQSACRTTICHSEIWKFAWSL